MKTLDDFWVGVLASIGVVLLVGVVAVFGGTIVWLIWPHALPVVFPKLVATGWILTEIPWWSAVCLTWLCGILIKSQVTYKK